MSTCPTASLDGIGTCIDSRIETGSPGIGGADCAGAAAGVRDSGAAAVPDVSYSVKTDAATAAAMTAATFLRVVENIVTP
jgi:hypothetical protein